MSRAGLAAVLLALWTVAPAAAGEKAPPAPSPRDKCPVCGMFVAPYPNWVGQIAYKDGERFHFDGAKDLFTYYFSPGRYRSARNRADIAGIHVTDYYSVAAIDGRKAFYVVGSDVRGPMGKELVPFAKKNDADGFLKDHKGQRVLRFDEVTPATLKSLE